MFWQFSEQQLELAVHAFPRVVQPPGLMAAHMLFAQLPEQHWALPVQALPFCWHAVALQDPPEQFRLQQSLLTVQGEPVPLQRPITHTRCCRSQAPEQHSAALEQDAPSPVQDMPGPSIPAEPPLPPAGPSVLPPEPPLPAAPPLPPVLLLTSSPQPTKKSKHRPTRAAERIETSRQMENRMRYAGSPRERYSFVRIGNQPLKD